MNITECRDVCLVNINDITEITFIILYKLSDNIYKLQTKTNLSDIYKTKSKIKFILPIYNWNLVENKLMTLLQQKFIFYKDNSGFIIEGTYKLILSFIVSYIKRYDKQKIKYNCVTIVVSFICIFLLNYDYDDFSNKVIEILYTLYKSILDISIYELVFIYNQIKNIHSILDINYVHNDVHTYINMLIQLLQTDNIIDNNTEIQIYNKYINSIILEITHTWIDTKHSVINLIPKMIDLCPNNNDQIIKIFKIWLLNTCKINNNNKIPCTTLLEKYKTTVNNNITQRIFGKYMRLCNFESKAIHGVRYYCNLEFK